MIISQNYGYDKENEDFIKTQIFSYDKSEAHRAHKPEIWIQIPIINS